MLRLTVPRLAREMTYVEVWEHFKRFGDARGPDSVTCRLLCTDDVAAQLNTRVKMRYLLEQFLVKSTPAGGAGGEQQRWWAGDFSRSVDGDRRRRGGAAQHACEDAVPARAVPRQEHARRWSGWRAAALVGRRLLA
ncbi:hypothetical protein DQ04_02081020 [Trypanosoma grayi]|uniref:hypothetical protein n=1 Tax=Trypanosoma grayi TaxID=71804 RepID=UPI0004F4B7CD|nr:hypothetical protein DQ04_02081020 [Trypanosoma grayi]KEG11999.1 hypothetical protein DQ04_02081020 [Trypanosoma grayi]